MNTKELIIQELDQVKEPVLEEILDFLRFLKTKQIQAEQEIQTDLQDARAALREAQEQGGVISLVDLKQELGLQ